MPRSSRLPDTTSTVVAILATTAGGPETVAGDKQTEAQAAGLRRKRREQRPALEDRGPAVSPDRHEVIEQPGVLDLGHGVGLAPDTKEVGVVDLLGRGGDPEAGVRHDLLQPFLFSSVTNDSRPGARHYALDGASDPAVFASTSWVSPS